MSPFNMIITHTLKEEGGFENPDETTVVTRGMVRERAIELAVISGRKPHETSKCDWEKAKQEMIGLPRNKFQ